MEQDVYLTIEEAALWLDPPVSPKFLWHLIQAHELEPEGQRYTGRRGRPALCYSMRQLMVLHAANISLKARHGGVNACVGMGPAKVPS